MCLWFLISGAFDMISGEIWGARYRWSISLRFKGTQLKTLKANICARDRADPNQYIRRLWTALSRGIFAYSQMSLLWTPPSIPLLSGLGKIRGCGQKWELQATSWRLARSGFPFWRAGTTHTGPSDRQVWTTSSGGKTCELCSQSDAVGLSSSLTWHGQKTLRQSWVK